MRRWITVVVLAALAACGGADEDPSESAADAEAESTTTTEVEAKTATVGQVAGVVAQYDTELREVMDQAEPCLVLIFPEDCDIAASVTVMTLGLKAQTLEIELRGFAEDRTNNQLYVGAYPEELVPLVDETLDAARTVMSLAEDWTDVCPADPSTQECFNVAFPLNSVVGDLEDALARWRPYL
jgi:hypothetical protein